MADYVLHYFNIRGRAELVRLVFKAAGQHFEDKRYEQEEWAAIKDSFPLGQMPVLEVKGHSFCQSLSLARFVAREFGLAGKTNLEQLKADMIVDTIYQEMIGKMGDMLFLLQDEEEKKKAKENQEKSFPKILDRISSWLEGDFFLGSTFSWADLALIDLEPWLQEIHPSVVWPKNLQRVVDSVKKNRPEVAEWLRQRPNTPA